MWDQLEHFGRCEPPYRRSDDSGRAGELVEVFGIGVLPHPQQTARRQQRVVDEAGRRDSKNERLAAASAHTTGWPDVSESTDADLPEAW